MYKLLIICTILLFGVFFPAKTLAYSPGFVTIVNPIRGDEFWDLSDQKPVDSVSRQLEILRNFSLPATWLLRFDALENKEIVSLLKKAPHNQEKGLFLEVTPSLAKAANVTYHKSSSWHQAGSALLTGYSTDERKLLVQTLFEKFKGVFGYYPTSVGAWWIDSFSLKLMTEEYHVNAGLIVADQYSTDDYQIWGQYWATPFYPYKTNALIPARDEAGKIPVVLMQWASRDPVNGYGKAVEESTYSLQPNDYIDYHGLDINYFERLVDTYLSQKNNQFNQLTVGLENSYSWSKYGAEYERQLAALKVKQSSGLQVTTMLQFASWYSRQFPGVSPSQLIIADNPLGGEEQTIWFQNPFYRIGIFKDSKGLSIKDIRQYRDGDQEVCLQERCDHVYFATSTTRVLDQVTFGKQWQLSEGKINDFKVVEKEGGVLITFTNQANTSHSLTLFPRDIQIDDTLYTVDAAILKALSVSVNKNLSSFPSSINLQMQPLTVVKDLALFVLFLTALIIIPGALVIAQIQKPDTFIRWIFLSTVYGLIQFVVLSYISGFFRVYLFAPVICGVFTFLYILKKDYKNIPRPKFTPATFVLSTIVCLGIVFQILPVVMSGSRFNYGYGFWGPNAHDGIWHLSLVNSILSGLPPNNPTFAGVSLINYHYLYDLLLATTHLFTGVATADLLFRYYPFIFSLLLGLGSISLVRLLSKEKTETQKFWEVFFTLFFVYFTGSFGWIVEFLRERHFGGESTFWANQPVSFNLNPPFAISLLVCILFFHLLFSEKRDWKAILILALVNASLLGFKAYLFLLTSTALLVLSLWELFKHKNKSLLVGLLTSGTLALGLYLPNFKASGVFMFKPLWLVHGMIDFPDRVGWAKLASARETYFQTGNWFKFFLAETISLGIFLVGNLGVRVIGLYMFFEKRIWRNTSKVILFIFTLQSFVLPLLFVQQGNSWNVIQFFYYGMYIAAVLTGILLGNLVRFKFKAVALFIIVAAVLIAPINSLVTATSYLVSRPHTFISIDELSALQFLQDQPAGVVLTMPYSKNTKNDFSEPRPLYAYETTAYVSAYSKHPTFLEDEIQQEILGTNYMKRRVEANEFLQSKGLRGRDILRANSIKYIYLQKHYNLSIEESPSIKNIFENGEVVIYQVN